MRTWHPNLPLPGRGGPRAGEGEACNLDPGNCPPRAHATACSTPEPPTTTAADPHFLREGSERPPTGTKSGGR
eukprot:2636247-Alexandrium_andersonii.AAC.1